MTHEFALVPALMLGALISQAISRKLNRHSFYEEIIEQDGHVLDRLVPPRDFHRWQQLPVSAIANYEPVVVTNLSPAEIQNLLRKHPYQRFPVVADGTLAGLLTRKEAQAALAERRNPKCEPAATCLPDELLGAVQGRLIETSSQFLTILDCPNGRVLGLLTLHDLLRAQDSVARESVT